LTLSKNKRLAEDSMKKIREIYKVADKNNVDVLESLNNYFTLTAQNDVFDNIKHLS